MKQSIFPPSEPKAQHLPFFDAFSPALNKQADDERVLSPTWTDCFGVTHIQVKTLRRLKYKYPLHAAIRRHVFHVDNYTCRRCGVSAETVPENYDGRKTLNTTSKIKSGWHDVLVVDHIVSLSAGGKNVISNFQTLCETCNKKKIKSDNRMAKAYRNEAKNG
jgi:5-methylcytosine-specific restriction endonuclease McrA